MWKLRSRLLAGCLMAFCISVVGLLTFKGYGYYQYVEHDPAFCNSCHLMEHAFATWKVSVHKDINCKSCHHSDPMDRMRFAVKSALNLTESVGKHTKLDGEVCQSCHYSGDSNMRQVADTVGHKKHVGQLGLQCLTCHVSTKENLHVFLPSPKNCLTCHTKSENNAGSMKEMHCTACHSFLDKDEAAVLTPKPETCLSCHSGMQVRDEVFSDDNPMPFACSDCHKPHTKPYLVALDCLTCHTDLFDNKEHINLGQSGMTDCVSCHRPHDWKPRPGVNYNKTAASH